MDQTEQALTILRLLRRCGRYLHHHWGDGRSSQFRALRILVEQGQLTQRQLQDLMEIQQGSLSELVKKLEDQGCIVRERDARDRRQLLIRVTDEGRRQNALRREARKQEGLDLVSVLDGEERQQLLELLGKLMADWEARCAGHHHHDSGETQGEGGGPG